jgi:hypothetical protein
MPKWTLSCSNLDPQTAKHEVENLMLAPERESLKLHDLEIGKLV